ncbi:hypothetical protein [Vibrio alfacsensis]|uniref:hypothetical protein n=1 Tax=Vibrio alfacsensis TaxID=1074311 RepID=UPI001BF160F4|nr:hypothetical protein [Vibrio alfacsensis]WQE75091.1 hypothetical protein SO574_07590 [Vibrio alfacsensis]BCN24316.1 hypothetical protein VYA_15080 [Vibrio alfacsensis]
MKNTIIALALSGFAASSFAAYDPASQTMQWTGTVPAATIAPDAGYVIKTTSALGLMNGTVNFQNVAGKVSVESSSELAFEVLKDVDADGTVSEGDTKLAYGLTLTNVKVGVDGAAPAEQADGFFQVNLNGVALAKDAAQAIAVDAAPSAFKITHNEAVTSTLEANQDVVLQAVVAIAPTEA